MTSVLSREQEYLLTLCRAACQRCAPPELEDRLAWETIAEALRHRLIYLVAGSAISRPTGRTSRPVVAFLSDSWKLNQHRHAVMAEWLRRIQKLLHGGGITALARKGVIYDALLHNGCALRAFDDIDVFVQPQQAKAAERLLVRDGFSLARYDPGERTLVASSAEAVLRFRVYRDHLPRLARSTHEPFVPVLELDVATDLFWHGSAYSGVSPRLLTRGIAEAVEEPRTGLRTLPPYLHWLDCTLHLYRDAFFRKTMLEHWDVRLSQFLDAALLWEALTAEERLRARRTVHKHDIVQPVGWVAHHVDELLLTNLSAELGIPAATLEPSPYTYQPPRAPSRPWNGTMADRLFAKDRTSLLRPDAALEHAIVTASSSSG